VGESLYPACLPISQHDFYPVGRALQARRR
jgi:hypothetical protein